MIPAPLTVARNVPEFIKTVTKINLKFNVPTWSNLVKCTPLDNG